MKTLAEIEKIKRNAADKYTTEVESTYQGEDWDSDDLIEMGFNEGFDLALALMLEREKVAKDALKAIVEEFEIDWAESQQYAREALEKLK